MAAETKACPDCAEQVQTAAKVCRHCGHRFGTGWQRWAVIVLVALFAGWWLVAALAGQAG